MVTLAKEGTLAARRLLIARLGSTEIAHLLVDEIAPHLRDRRGGYTRVLKLGSRPGDGAETALVGFSVPIEFKSREVEPSKGTKEKKAAEKKPAKIEKKVEKIEKEKPEGEKRGGFLSKLRKFLTGDENK